MVFVAFLLLTVSTLAVHCRGVSPGGILLPSDWNPNATYYTKEPPGYPREDIDKHFKDGTPKHLEQSDVLKIEDLEPASLYGNCAMEVKTITPYIIRDGNGKKPRYVLQSKYFTQTLPDVQCTNQDRSEAETDKVGNVQECFRDYILPGHVSTRCIQRKIRTKLYLYDEGQKKLYIDDGEVNVDCVCAKQQNSN